LTLRLGRWYKSKFAPCRLGAVVSMDHLIHFPGSHGRILSVESRAGWRSSIWQSIRFVIGRLRVQVPSPAPGSFRKTGVSTLNVGDEESYGQMAERLMAADCKSAALTCYGGSNPSLPTIRDANGGNFAISGHASNPRGVTGFFAHVAQLVEHVLGKDGVSRSNRLVGSNYLGGFSIPPSPPKGSQEPRTSTSTTERGSNSVGRVTAFQAVGRGFEPRLPLHVSRTGDAGVRGQREQSDRSPRLKNREARPLLLLAFEECGPRGFEPRLPLQFFEPWSEALRAFSFPLISFTMRGFGSAFLRSA
jgi:hypothetical protein